MPDELSALERQVEQGNLFAHAELSKQSHRANEADALLNGLVALLVQRKVVDGDELMAIVDSAREHVTQKVEVALRIDEPGEEPQIDCAARIHVCKAVCCRLHWALSIEEVEAGLIRWELGRPYFNRHNADGYCHQWDGGCQIYDQRPNPCRMYSCEHDERIWKDFDAMELNDEWIAEYLVKQRGPVELFMDAVRDS